MHRTTGRLAAALATVGILAVGVAPAVADSDVGSPTDLGTPDLATPAGPATLSSPWHGQISIADPSSPYVLTGWKVRVGPGSQAGLVRIRAVNRDGGTSTAVLGDWVTLPAAAGDYTFPAPRVHWDGTGFFDHLALDQQTGGHTIVQDTGCDGYGHCPQTLGVFHDLADTDPADVTASLPAGVDPPPGFVATPPTDSPDRHDGERLAVTAVSEPDLDYDLVPDSEEHASLSLTARVTSGTPRRVTLTVRNDGTTEATMPYLRIPGVTGYDGKPHVPVARKGWSPTCLDRWPGWDGGWLSNGTTQSLCLLAPLPAGASRTVSAPVAGWARTLTVRAQSEAADGPHGTVTVAVPPTDDGPPDLDGPPAPTCTLTLAQVQRLGRGIRVRLTATTAQSVRVSVRLVAGSHRTTVAATARLHKGPNTVVLHPRGRAATSLRNALRRHRGSVRVRVTATAGAPVWHLIRSATLKR
jgi:hypothetical protein